MSGVTHILYIAHSVTLSYSKNNFSVTHHILFVVNTCLGEAPGSKSVHNHLQAVHHGNSKSQGTARQKDSLHLLSVTIYYIEIAWAW